MKTVISTLALAILLMGGSSTAQCDNSALKSECSSLLNSFIFVKSFNVSKASEFSYVFSKGTTYVITCCDPAADGKKMVVELYDRNRKKIASNVVKGKYYSKIGYPCGATGVYYMKYSFQGGASGCGVSVIGFKK